MSEPALDPATYTGPTFSGTWVNTQRYVGPEGTGTWVQLDPPDDLHPVDFVIASTDFNPFTTTEFPGCGGAGGTTANPTPTLTPSLTTPATPTPTRTPTTFTATPTWTAPPSRTPSPSPTPCVQGVRGFVRDAQTRAGVGGMLVRVGDNSVTTGSDGRYRIEVPVAGPYQVFVGQTRDYIGNSESVRIPDCGFVDQDVLVSRVATPTPQGGGSGGVGGSGCSWTGTWVSQNQPDLVLRQSGTQVTGTYGYYGNVRGTISGDVMTGTVTDSSGRTRPLELHMSAIIDMFSQQYRQSVTPCQVMAGMVDNSLPFNTEKH